MFASGAIIYGYVGGNPVNFIDPEGLFLQGVIPGGELGGALGGPYGAVAGAIIGGILGEQALEAILDPIYQAVKGNVDPLDSAGGTEHTSGARPSTEGTHEKGSARKRQDRGREKGDESRDLPRRRPAGWKGPWPPKSCNN